MWANVANTTALLGRIAALPAQPGLQAEIAIFLPSSAAKARTYGMMFGEHNPTCNWLHFSLCLSQ